MQEELWTARETARRLRIRLPTLYGWVAAGKIPFFRIGRSLRFSPEALARWLDDQAFLTDPLGHNRKGGGR
jgi:excisionase family DNA binding protein